MFSLGYWEILIVLLIVLVVLGPQRLPETARQIARLTRMFREASEDLRRNLMTDSRPYRPPENSTWKRAEPVDITVTDHEPAPPAGEAAEPLATTPEPAAPHPDEQHRKDLLDND